ncbi:hypothetical protein LINPERPRIM_LOCUS33691 [Linum perenne]
MQINSLESRPLQNLNPQVISKDGEEILIVCAQFRLHHLNHNNSDERSEFLRVLRSLEPSPVPYRRVYRGRNFHPAAQVLASRSGNFSP